MIGINYNLQCSGAASGQASHFCIKTLRYEYIYDVYLIAGISCELSLILVPGRLRVG